MEDPDLVTELLAAGADARVAQQAAEGGTGSGEDLLLASTRVREAVETAVRAVSVVLDRSGHEMAEETARRIRTTLQAAVTGGVAEREALWRGTLDRDLKPAGFGAADGPDDDVPELAKVLQPLRRRAASPRPGGLAQGQARAGSNLVAQRAAQRAMVERRKAAERTRAIATTKRQYAERLAGEARAAEDEASAAERAAEAAEEAARVDRVLPEG